MIVYEVDPKEYLERQRRVQAMFAELDGKDGVVAAEWAERFRAIQDEVAEVPLEVGKRYRIRLIGGKLTEKRYRGTMEDGSEKVVELPGVEDVEWQEIEGTFAGRQQFEVARSAIFLDLGGSAAMFGDADILRCEELLPGSDWTDPKG